MMAKDLIDIPLEFADLFWSPGPDGNAVVLHHFEHVDAPSPYPKMAGCMDWGWTMLGARDRLLTLLSAAWSAAVRDGVPPGVLHRALLSVPEYRGLIALRAEPDFTWEEDR